MTDPTRVDDETLERLRKARSNGYFVYTHDIDSILSAYEALRAERESTQEPPSTQPRYNERALAERHIDFLEARADEWMEDTSVQRMFNAIASVFEKWADQALMDRFREKLGDIGRQCFVEGALRAWEEISSQQRALGAPLPQPPGGEDDKG